MSADPSFVCILTIAGSSFRRYHVLQDPHSFDGISYCDRSVAFYKLSPASDADAWDSDAQLTFFFNGPFCKHPGAVPVQQTTGTGKPTTKPLTMPSRTVVSILCDHRVVVMLLVCVCVCVDGRGQLLSVAVRCDDCILAVGEVLCWCISWFVFPEARIA